MAAAPRPTAIALPPAVEHVVLRDGRCVALHPRPVGDGEDALRGFLVTAQGMRHEPVIGEACYRRTPDTRVAEFALAVAPGWRRLGIGATLIEALCRDARHEGLLHMAGLVAADDAAVLELLERCGFDLRPDAEHQGFVAALRPLPARQASLLAPPVGSPLAPIAGWWTPSRTAGPLRSL